MRKVPGDARRTARRCPSSTEEWREEGGGGGVTEGERAARVEPVHDNQRQYKQNKQSSKHQTKFVFLPIIVFFSLSGILTSQLYIM